MVSVTWVDLIVMLALIALILLPFNAIRLGIYSGFHIKKRWFLPMIESSVCYVLFKVAEWFFLGDLIIMKFEIIVLFIWMTLSFLAMFVTVIMKKKKPCWIRVSVSIVLIVVVTFSWGIGLNREYCPTYYKYPDYIIKELLLPHEIESLFGEFDVSERGYAAYGGYYAYTDEQGNDWYYTIHFLEGDVTDIRMEIH